MHDTHQANQPLDPEAPHGQPPNGLSSKALAYDEGEAALDPADFEPREIQLPAVRRTLTVLAILIALGIAIALPPLLNVNRFRRQIATSISNSLGRPVHMDQVTLNLLPTPGFTLENFVVGEDPSFGTEPVIHANSVHARLRIRSLWRRRVEFSRISLTDTSLNLVHRPDGRWNVESILLQASRIDAAPTGQRSGGAAPRFPYIEATNARVNVKMGLEKMPLALTETEFALWLPQPQQWRLRLLGHPSRTDNAASDTGSLRIEGTLGKAGTLAEVPADLVAEWSGAPLGAVSWVLLGHDADIRGDMTLKATTVGTLGHNLLGLRLALHGARRAEFVPTRSLDLTIVCQARAEEVFHRLENLNCAAPADSLTPAVTLTGTVPQTFTPASAILQAQLHKLDAAFLLDALRLASPHVSPALRLTGSLSGTLALTPPAGEITLADTQLRLGESPPLPLPRHHIRPPTTPAAPGYSGQAHLRPHSPRARRHRHP